MITEITDHAAQAQARLPSRYNKAAQFQALINLIAGRYQDLENVTFDLYLNRSLANAAGTQLDNLGTILNLSRKIGETDASYRARLYSETSELEKSGELESVITIFNFLMGVPITTATFVQETYPAGLTLVAHNDADPQDAITDANNRTAMNVVKAGGIELILEVATESDYFYFSDISEVDANNNGPTDALHGFGDATLTEGGTLARAF